MIAYESDCWNVEQYQQLLSSVPGAGKILIELLAPVPGERVLDIGCGDGSITEKILRHGCEVIGVDASMKMVTAASKRGIDARYMDARYLTFDNEFDAVFSHAALHWIKDTELAIGAIAKALKANGRFVAECGVIGNISLIESALILVLNEMGYDGQQLNPWHHISPNAYRILFTHYGLVVELLRVTPCMVALPRGMREWLQTFVAPFLSAVPLSEHETTFEKVENRLRPVLMDQNGVWHVDYVRMWVKAWKRQHA